MRAIAEEQISAFLENRPGVVANMCAAMTERKVNIKAMTVLDTKDVGTLRMVVDDLKGACEALAEAGAAYVLVPVVVVPIPNRPGAFAMVARTFADADINIEYVYVTAVTGQAPSLAIFRVSDTEKALQIDFDV